MKHLGLMQQVIDRGAVIEAAASYNSRGDTTLRLPTNLTDVPSVCLHRAELQQALFWLCRRTAFIWATRSPTSKGLTVVCWLILPAVTRRRAMV